MEQSFLQSAPKATAVGVALLLVVSACAPVNVRPQPVFTQPASTPSTLTTAAGISEKMSTDTTVRVVVIGDSLSTGLGTSPKQAWPELLKSVLLPDKRAVEITNAAENGSGYLATGVEGDTFRMEVQASVTPATDVILFFGSDNDTGTDPEELKAAVTSAFDAASSLAPKATLVAIGPLSSEEEPEQMLADICSSEASAAQNSGVKFIDPIADHWLSGRADVLLGPDREHPSAKGQRFLRDKMKRIIGAVLPH